MAECHPVAFQWVMEAKAKGATVIHVDPRFTRTSAVADLHVPIRAGSDIAFVGGLINYVLTTGKFFCEYVVSYTNAATIVTPALGPSLGIAPAGTWMWMSWVADQSSGRSGKSSGALART